MQVDDLLKSVKTLLVDYEIFPSDKKLQISPEFPDPQSLTNQTGVLPVSFVHGFHQECWRGTEIRGQRPGELMDSSRELMDSSWKSWGTCTPPQCHVSPRKIRPSYMDIPNHPHPLIRPYRIVIVWIVFFFSRLLWWWGCSWCVSRG